MAIATALFVLAALHVAVRSYAWAVFCFGGGLMALTESIVKRMP